MSDELIDGDPQERQAAPFGRQERAATPGSEARRAVIAGLLGAGLGVFVALFSRREQRD